MYYFDSFGVEIPPFFLEEYVDLGSNERIQQNDDSYCGAYCLYMIYLIDKGFRIKSALNILVNQCKYPGTCNECFCLGCDDNVFDNDNVTDNDKDNVNDNDNQGTCLASHEQSSFADNNDKVKDNDSVNDTVNNKDNDNVNVKDHDNVNDSNNDNDIDNDNDNDNVNVTDNDNVNDNVNDKDKDNDNVNDNGNQGTCFADDNFCIFI